MMPFIIGLAVVILAISLRNLISMENSLEEGRGPQGEILLMTIPMMVLVVSLMLLMVNKTGTGIKALRDNIPITALMLAMFIIGMLIEPMIPRPEGTLGDALGTTLLLVPILLIAFMILPSGQRIPDEEE
ncbi:MAG: hypothetical protein MKZ60_02490 [Candidatus Thalassarchaeum sp.]|nr:hypothetical protein [Candidatus Thalassarchaeum sp.]